MATLPAPEPRPHQFREMAESFGSDAQRYDRTRQPYPEPMVRRIIAASPGPHMLEVGCGTGIAARQFQAAGCQVLGVEPDARMADFARHTGIEVDVATFEAWDPADRLFDAVLAGQSWHWVDPVAGAAKAARVLRPGGRLAAFWHVMDLPPTVQDAFSSAFARVAPDSPLDLRKKGGPDAYADGYFRLTHNGIREAGGFGELEQWRFPWEREYTRDEWLEQMPTTGVLTRLPKDKLAEVLDSVGAAIDTMGGRFTMSYLTVVATATHG